MKMEEKEDGGGGCIQAAVAAGGQVGRRRLEAEVVKTRWR